MFIEVLQKKNVIEAIRTRVYKITQRLKMTAWYLKGLTLNLFKLQRQQEILSHRRKL